MIVKRSRLATKRSKLLRNQDKMHWSCEQDHQAHKVKIVKQQTKRVKGQNAVQIKKISFL
jgi:hypothetical protein